MIRARLSNGVFLLGIDSENVKRLKEGKPIVLSLAELGGTDDVMIVYGETLKDIVEALEAATGQPLPAPKKLKDIRNEQ
jgi:hypothetical protein